MLLYCITFMFTVLLGTGNEASTKSMPAECTITSATMAIQSAKSDVQDPEIKLVQKRTSLDEPSLDNTSNNDSQACAKNICTSATPLNPNSPKDKRIQYGGKSLEILKDNLINLYPETYSTDNLQLIIPNDDSNVQTTAVSGQTSNVEPTQAIVVQTTSKRRLPISSNVKVKKPMPKCGVVSKQIQPKSDDTQRQAKMYVSKTLNRSVNPSATVS